MVTTVETLVFDAPGQARTRHRVTLSGCEGEPWSESCEELALDPACETTLEWLWTAPTDG